MPVAESKNHLFHPGALFCYFVAIMIGSLHAQVFPTLSVFLVDKFRVSPFFVGLFFVAVAASSMIVSQWVGVFSDKQAFLNRRILIFLSMIAGGLACAAFAYSPSYGFAFSAAIFIFSFAFVSLPQIMALGREFAEQSFDPKQIPMFNAMLRAAFAFSWVASPPLGFHLQHVLGVSEHYLMLTGLYFFVGLLAWMALPKVQPLQNTEEPKTLADIDASKIPFAVKLGFVAFSLMFAVNHSYMIAMPQLLVQHMNVESFYAGRILGLAAAIEIPFMILAGWLATRLPIIYLIRFSCVAAILLYVGVWHSTAVWQLYALQILNAIFIGFMASVGMTWFQNHMPKYPGTASSLFTNTMNGGNIVGSILLGVFAAWLGYQHLYLVNAVVALLALGVLVYCR